MLNRNEVARRLSLYYSELFSGDVWSDFDEMKRAYVINGSGLPSHPSSPNPTWSLLDYIKPTVARLLVTSKTDAELLELASIKAAQVKAEADAIVEEPNHPWRIARLNRKTGKHSE
jgi:hypothetical protein